MKHPIKIKERIIDLGIEDGLESVEITIDETRKIHGILFCYQKRSRSVEFNSPFERDRIFQRIEKEINKITPIADLNYDQPPEETINVGTMGDENPSENNITMSGKKPKPYFAHLSRGGLFSLIEKAGEGLLADIAFYFGKPYGLGTERDFYSTIEYLDNADNDKPEDSWSDIYQKVRTSKILHKIMLTGLWSEIEEIKRTATKTSLIHIREELLKRLKELSS